MNAKKYYKQLFLLLFFACSNFFIFGQPYGNEWIQPSQRYFKIKITQEGIYRVDFTTLSTVFFQSGVDLTTINPRKIQVFSMGKEIPIHLRGEEDGIFNFSDFIEFYAFPNNGVLDEDLYFSGKPGDLLHTQISMFTDTGIYYITFLPNISPQNGLRYEVIRNHNLGSQPAEPYFRFKSEKYFNEVYYAGHPFVVNNSVPFYLPEYTEAEGWCGVRFGQGPGLPSSRTEALTMPALFNGGFNPIIDFKIISSTRNNIVSLDHHFRFNVSKDNSLFSNLYDTFYSGFGVISKVMSVDRNLLLGSNTSYFRMEAVNVAGVSLQAYNPSYLSLEYPREFNMAGFTSIKGKTEPSNTPKQLNWTNYGVPGNSRPIVYDFTNRRRITPVFGSGQTFSYINPPSTQHADFVIADSTSFQFITAIQPVTFVNTTSALNNTQFLIITTRSLSGPEANDYLNYRRTSFAANMFIIEDLYESFTFGITHPAAIRRFLAYLINNSNVLKPEYLLLIGRGIQPELLRNPNFRVLNRLPAIGSPASDYLYSAGLGGKPHIVPYLATGRIAVDTRAHIRLYLNKLIEQEQSPNAQWKKHVMHLGGGYDGQESRIIRGRLESLEYLPKSAPFGGKVTGLYRSGNDLITETNLRTQAVNIINNGTSLITFLGHGSATVLDVDIGDTIDYVNKGRLPVMYFNGCRVGNPSIGYNNGNLFFGERMIRAKDRGAIVFIGQTSISELFSVSSQMNSFYQQLFVNSVGVPAGKSLRNAIENNLNPNNFLNRYHNSVLLYQGDPAFTIYNAQLPDYFVTPSSLFINPENVNSLSDSFRLGIVVGNAGKFTPHDSFNISIKRTWPNDFKVEEYTLRVPPVAYADTFFFTFKTRDIATTGRNIFNVILNPDRTREESDYSNNEVAWERFIEGNGISLLYPRRFAIHHQQDSVTLVAQSLNLSRVNNQFIFEIDTTPKFNSPWLKRTQPAINTGNIARWKVSILTNDSQVYYWRGRLNLPTNQGGFWEERSFIYIKDGQNGWSQSHHPQFYPSTDLNRIELDIINRTFNFQKTQRFVWVDTRVNSHSNLGVKFAGFFSQDVNPGAGGNFVAVLLDRNTLRQFLLPNHYPKCWRGAQWPPFQAEQQTAYYCFGTSPADINDFEALINDLPEGTYVALFTRYDAQISTWSEQLKSIFRRIGGSLFEGYPKNQAAYVLVGQKGAAPGTMFEDLSHLTESVTAGYAAIEGVIFGRQESGSITSERIGPAESWDKIYFDWRPTSETPNSDILNYSVIGVDTNNAEIVLYQNLTQNTLDISNLNAKRFRHLKLRANFRDELDRSAPQLKHWLVTFEELPEGTINTFNQYVFNKDTIMEGDSFRVNIAFENISEKNLDSVLYEFKIVDMSNQNILQYEKSKGRPISPGEAVYVRTAMSSIGHVGKFAFNISFNPGEEQPELTLSNNTINIPFMIVNDRLNPILDVTFDGRHIINGEIVSPTPLILITSKDENPFLLQQDSSNFELLLRRPNSPNFETVDMSTGEISFRPATNANNVASIEYKPQNLPDGKYSLRVQTKDVSGNAAAKEHFSIDFQVVNESAITNFYPYPNPFSTQMRFVFTLTGKEIPDDIIIKIMTVSGRVVREINKDELGTIRIGNNVSEFTWDGTDQYGDRLSNGVYLYHVQVKNNGESLKRRESAGDNSFKKDVGKIYLLR